MKQSILSNIFLEIMICFAGIAILFLLAKICLSYINEKRIKSFTMDSKDNDIMSIGDHLKNIFIRLVKMISKIVKKSAVLSKYSNKFEKYLIFDEKSKYTKEDVISFKFIMMFLVQILYIILWLLGFNKMVLPLFLLASLVGFFIIDLFLLIFYRNKTNQIEEQLLQAIVIMNNAFKSGKNIMQAVNIVQNELPNPIKDEFKIIAKDISYGLDLATVFDRFAKRVKVSEAKYITSSLSLLSKTGGNIVTVFNMIERTFYERLKIKNELSSLTSASRFLYKLLLFMPFIFIIIIVMLNPTYFMPLINSTIGLLIDGIIIILYICYILIIKKVMKVEEV